jgi:hypothetical protein
MTTDVENKSNTVNDAEQQDYVITFTGSYAQKAASITEAIEGVRTVLDNSNIKIDCIKVNEKKTKSKEKK